MVNTFELNKINQKNSLTPFSGVLEAIASGVETRLRRTIVRNIVTLETIYIARKMHIPEEDIQEWRTSRYHKSNSTQNHSAPPIIKEET